MQKKWLLPPDTLAATCRKVIVALQNAEPAWKSSRSSSLAPESICSEQILIKCSHQPDHLACLPNDLKVLQALEYERDVERADRHQVDYVHSISYEPDLILRWHLLFLSLIVFGYLFLFGQTSSLVRNSMVKNMTTMLSMRSMMSTMRGKSTLPSSSSWSSSAVEMMKVRVEITTWFDRKIKLGNFFRFSPWGGRRGREPGRVCWSKGIRLCSTAKSATESVSNKEKGNIRAFGINMCPSKFALSVCAFKRSRLIKGDNLSQTRINPGFTPGPV